MSTELVTVKPNAGVMFYSVRNLDHDAILAKLDEEMPEGGNFPGDALTFDGKRGQWRWGYGKKGQVFDHTKLSFVFNLANAVEGWQRFVTDEASGKTYPFFGDMVFICDPRQKLKSREEMGDNNPENWPVDGFGKKADPWKRFVACPIRIDGEETVNHIFMGTISSVIAFKGLMREFAEQGKTQLGKLPIVNVGRGTRERRESKETYDVPTFDIVAWDDPIAADLPEGGEVTAAKVQIPEASVVSRQRTTVVENLQQEANASAKAEVEARTATVQRIVSDAKEATGNQRRTSPGGSTSPLNGAGSGVFAGAGGRRQSSSVKA